MAGFDVVEASIAALRAALRTNEVTSCDLVRAFQDRIAHLDRSGSEQWPALNSVVVDNPLALEEARASDARRARGELLGPLDGIPYTVKDSYLVTGLTAACGSPAFSSLLSQWDAFAVERLRAGGAICLGKTNMPPMANGGMQRGLYGRAESPYNPAWLAAPFGSGSSNGSGTAVAASFCAFGLGEETWSSGRGPASNSGLCAYTPSRGVISVRGNWPLVPTMDVVVPHTRSLADLLEVLDVIVADDSQTRGDLWRSQPWVSIPAASAIRPESYVDLAAADLRGMRLGVPAMYLGTDSAAGLGATGIGGPTGATITPRGSLVALFEALRSDLEAAGAVVVDVDFPVVTNYEGDRLGAPTVETRGLVGPEYLRREIVDLSAWAWEDFLDANGDPEFSTLVGVDGAAIFPHPAGALPDRYAGFDDDIADYTGVVAGLEFESFLEMPELAAGLAGLEETRRVDLEEWMVDLGLDAVIFPAVADIGAADMDVNPVSAEAGWRNGVWVANGNLVPRHLGIPTVTVPMGLLSDIAMPVGLTIAGPAYSDTWLLQIALAIEATAPDGSGTRRLRPPLRSVESRGLTG